MGACAISRRDCVSSYELWLGCRLRHANSPTSFHTYIHVYIMCTSAHRGINSHTRLERKLPNSLSMFYPVEITCSGYVNLANVGYQKLINPVLNVDEIFFLIYHPSWTEIKQAKRTLSQGMWASGFSFLSTHACGPHRWALLLTMRAGVSLSVEELEFVTKTQWQSWPFQRWYDPCSVHNSNHKGSVK